MQKFGIKFLSPLLLCSAFLAQANSIDTFKNTWVGQSLAKQQQLDIYQPISQNNIPGTHNTYNSEVYRACNFRVGCRYLDPQQKHSIYDQLRMGARFIEIDVHWTRKMESLFSYPKRLLMCHGVCSLNDKYLTEGLDEIRNWLNSSDSHNQVIILYIEDHMQGHHNDAYQQIQSRFGQWIYRSNGCQAIPANLTKADIISQGKKVLLWGDGGCSGDISWKQTAFTGLGAIGRIWEDRTTLGTIANVVQGGSTKYISADDVARFFREGANIVNLDDMVTDDGRLAAAVWSWDNNEPNNWSGDQDCAVQWQNGRWDDDFCHVSYVHACKHQQTGEWRLSNLAAAWDQGQAQCQQLGTGFQFDVPTNSKDNQALKAVKDAANHSHIWLNHDDRAQEGHWRVAGKSTQL